MDYDVNEPSGHYQLSEEQLAEMERMYNELNMTINHNYTGGEVPEYTTSYTWEMFLDGYRNGTEAAKHHPDVKMALEVFKTEDTTIDRDTYYKMIYDYDLRLMDFYAGATYHNQTDEEKAEHEKRTADWMTGFLKTKTQERFTLKDFYDDMLHSGFNNYLSSITPNYEYGDTIEDL